MADRVYIPEGYRSPLDVYETQRVIDFIKHAFQRELSVALNLKRVSAPLVVESDLGINDNLSGTERPVRFDVPDVGRDSEVVQSLAKWKRYALKKYDFSLHEDSSPFDLARPALSVEAGVAGGKKIQKKDSVIPQGNETVKFPFPVPFHVSRPGKGYFFSSS